nr:hypothetical protein [Tanacetum cinerariifolium]
VLDLEESKTTQAKKIASLKKRVKKLEKRKKSRTSVLKRLRKVGSARRVESLSEASLGDQEDASKHRKMIDNIDQDVVVDVLASEKVEQSVKVVEKEVSTADPVTTAGEVVTTAGIEVTTAATTLQIFKDELTLAQTLIEINAAKPKSKGKMVEPERPLKRKDQIMMDAEVAKNLKAQIQAEFEDEERIARLKEKETNIDLMLFNNTMTLIEAFVLIDTEKIAEGSEKAVEGSEKAEERSSKRARNDDDVTIEATPLSSKSPTIVDYKIYKEGRKSFFKIIRAYGNSQSYLTFGKMFKNINREDLENMVYYLLVEKMYPFTRNFLLQMWNDVRLQDDDDQDDNDDDQDTDNDSDDFVHPRLSIHEEEAKDEESFDPIV